MKVVIAGSRDLPQHLSQEKFNGLVEQYEIIQTYGRLNELSDSAILLMPGDPGYEEARYELACIVMAKDEVELESPDPTRE